MINKIYSLLILAAVLAGCKSKQAAVNSDQIIQEGSSQDVAIELLVKLYQSDNIVLSPLSIKTAVSMLYMGATGMTEAEMQNAFHLGENTTGFHKRAGARLGIIEKDSANTVVSLANGLWVEKDYQVNQEFIKEIKEHYSANLSEVSFQSAAERTKAVEEINQWISNATRDKIKNLISGDALTPLTRMVLVNAIYFKSNWRHLFNENNNTREPFTTLNGEGKKATFMNQNQHLKMLKRNDFTMLEMPYSHEQYSMLFFLPDHDKDPSTVLSGFKPFVIDSLLNQQPTYVNLKLPKFKIEYKSTLNNTLKSMGMEKAFSNDAGFQKISAVNELKVTDVLHGAFIEVNEQGTEAAGATGVVIGIKSAPMGKPVPFHLDRPFVFMIYDKKASEVLFSGVLARP